MYSYVCDIILNDIYIGKVPVLDTGSQIITESLVISDYLDEKYPEPPLHPSSPELKQKQKDLVEIVDGLIKVFYKFVWGKEELNLNAEFEALKPQVEQLENELEKQGSKYTGCPIFSKFSFVRARGYASLPR